MYDFGSIPFEYGHTIFYPVNYSDAVNGKHFLTWALRKVQHEVVECVELRVAWSWLIVVRLVGYLVGSKTTSWSVTAMNVINYVINYAIDIMQNGYLPREMLASQGTVRLGPLYNWAVAQEQSNDGTDRPMATRGLQSILHWVYQWMGLQTMFIRTIMQAIAG